MSVTRLRVSFLLWHHSPIDSDKSILLYFAHDGSEVTKFVALPYSTHLIAQMQVFLSRFCFLTVLLSCVNSNVGIDKQKSLRRDCIYKIEMYGSFRKKGFRHLLQHFWQTQMFQWHWIDTKIYNNMYVSIASLNSESACKLINRIQVSRCQQAFSKSCLVNLISNILCFCFNSGM